jgi:hypothetical protein
MIPIFAGRPSSTPPSQFDPKRLAGVLFFMFGGFSLFLLIPLLIFIIPYHAIREHAAAFDVSPNCHDAATSSSGAVPCTIEWANVVNRYYSSSSSKSSSSYRYYLLVRSGSGDQSRVDLKNQEVFWRTRIGDALKLQRWGGRITNVLLTSGVSSETAQNPDWELQNEIRGLRVILICEIVLIAIAGVAGFGLRAYVFNPTS